MMKKNEEFAIFYAFGLVNLVIILVCVLELGSIDLIDRSPISFVSRVLNQNRPLSNTSQPMRLPNTSEVLGRVPSSMKNVHEDRFGQIVHDDIHRIQFGAPLTSGRRAPLVMIRKRLDTDVHRRFLQYHPFSCNESELNELNDYFDKRVKIPIYIYEGYFHSMVTNENIFSRNPNPKIGLDFMKPAAEDKFIRAFYEAFRLINHEIFDRLRADLLNSAIMRHPNNPELDVCYGLAKWIERGCLFGDLSMQIHFGKGNNETFRNAWHSDAENSLLHLAVTLRGNRVLHSRRSLSSMGSPSEVLEPQSPGDVYLSSSTLMLHAPEFPTSTFDERTVSIHARILYTTDELQLFRKNTKGEDWEVLTNIIASTLSKADLQVPTVAQIHEVERKLT